MRIALVNWSSRRAGGAETYLATLIPALTALGHDVSLWREDDQPGDRDAIAPSGVFDLRERDAVTRLREWRPSVVYCHGLQDPALERRVMDAAPAVFFAHSYYGTCISGTKTWSFAVVRPCSRRFGPACLAHFYPHRCGGLNPATMLRDYSRQRERLALLPAYAAILTNSAHMRDEYLRHGFASERVHTLTFPVPGSALPAERSRSLIAGPLRLAFVGRMDRLKGGEFLLKALPDVRQALGRPVVVTMAGDGPERSRWEQTAAALSGADPAISVTFPGWLARPEVEHLLASIDLLVVPSLWPEPFGMIGPEAGRHGVPVAAFATGGVHQWLQEGVNGFTVSGNPPTATGLAQAIVRCVRDPATYARLSEGALRVARQFTMEAHLRELLPVLERVRA